MIFFGGGKNWKTQKGIYKYQSKNVKGGVVTDKTGLKIFVVINAMIFAFITFVTNTPLWAKNASKV